jgi:hypothetical protein
MWGQFDAHQESCVMRIGPPFCIRRMVVGVSSPSRDSLSLEGGGERKGNERETKRGMGELWEARSLKSTEDIATQDVEPTQQQKD